MVSAYGEFAPVGLRHCETLVVDCDINNPPKQSPASLGGDCFGGLFSQFTHPMSRNDVVAFTFIRQQLAVCYTYSPIPI